MIKRLHTFMIMLTI